MARKAVLTAVLLVFVGLVVSCSTQSAPPARSSEANRQPQPSATLSYLGREPRDEIPASRGWARIEQVSRGSDSPNEQAVEITGVAESSAEATTVTVFVYTSDGSVAPIVMSRIPADGRFRVVADLPAAHATGELSRFEVISVGGQHVFVDVREWVWADSDGGQLKPVTRK